MTEIEQLNLETFLKRPPNWNYSPRSLELVQAAVRSLLSENGSLKQELSELAKKTRKPKQVA